MKTKNSKQNGYQRTLKLARIEDYLSYGRIYHPKTNCKPFWFHLLPVVQKNLEMGEVLSVDVSCIAAVTATVNIQIKFSGTMRRALFGVSCFHFLQFALFSASVYIMSC